MFFLKWFNQVFLNNQYGDNGINEYPAKNVKMIFVKMEELGVF